MTACQQDGVGEKSVDYGYVAFRLTKQSTVATESATRAKLDWLSDAHKVTVTMQSLEDLTTLKQTLPITYYDKELAEWGVTSDKLRLLVGDYKVLGYKLYDNLDNELMDAQCEGVEFTVVKGGLDVCEIVVEDATKRGKIGFRLVKLFEDTRVDGDYLFESIKAVDIVVKRDRFVADTLMARKLSLSEEFVKTNNEDGAQTKSVLTAYIECEESFWLEIGKYTIQGYTTYSDAKANNVLETASIADLNMGFEVALNQLHVVKDVPVKLSKSAEHIKDYIALKEIWEALDGDNWSFHGEEYPAGSNWNFDKEIDMWGDQPGVTLNAEGRVENLNLSGFGAKGVVPDAIGQLTELKLLYLGNHNELIGGYDASESEAIDKYSYYNNVLKRDAREGLSAELKSAINRDATQRPILSSRINRKDVAFGNLTNGITGISRAMMRLEKLEQFFIANAPITTENFFVGEKDEALSWANFTNLMDVEIYNCPNLTALPRELITELPNLQSLNVAMNYGISGEQLLADWVALIDGKSGDKVQILYLGYNNLTETPSYDKLKNMLKIGLLDCNSNKLKTIHPFGKTVNPTTLIYDYNQIETINTVDGYFCGYSQLEDFTCSNNRLTELPDLFTAKSVNRFKSVDFSSNEISALQNGNYWRGVNTETLNLANNRFKELPKRLIGSGSQIGILMLSSNGMTTIEEGALIGAGSEYLTTIDLSFNRLTKLPYDDFSISNIPFLYGIDLSSNAFAEFPDAPLSVDRLSVISIRQQRDDDGNRTLSEWPEGIGNHKSLAALYIGSNDLGNITDTISPYIMIFEIKDNPNISIDLSSVCQYIELGYYLLVYDSTQDIRGCSILNLD